MTIYISVPSEGQNDTKAREKADRIQAYLSRQGHKAINPFDIYPGERPKFADYVCSGLCALADADAIYLCDGWRDTVRGRLEHAFAIEFGKPRIYEKRYEDSNYYFDR